MDPATTAHATLPRRLLVIACFGRSGSSLIWHALSSSPDVIAVDGEFHEILFRRNRFYRALYRIGAKRAPSFVRRSLADWTWRRLLASAERSILREPYAWKTDSERYVTGSAHECFLCVKVMGWDVGLCDFLRQQFEGSQFVGFVRDGRAILEGWQRRGMPVHKAARRYRDVCAEMLRQSSLHADFQLQRYEDFVSAPFAETERLLTSMGLAQRPDGKFMVKMKGVTTTDGYKIAGGQDAGVRYVGSEEAKAIIVPAVNQAQIAKLEHRDLERFMAEAADVLSRFGYEAG